jgi:hypothetical protein
MAAKKTSKKKATKKKAETVPKGEKPKGLTIAEWIAEKLKPIEPKPRMTSGNTNARKVLKKTEH